MRIIPLICVLSLGVLTTAPSVSASAFPFYALSPVEREVAVGEDFEIRYGIVGEPVKEGGWIGLYKLGSPDNDYVDWDRVRGRTGSVYLKANERGTYEARFHLDRTYDTKSKSLPITVRDAEDLPKDYSLTIEERRVREGDRVGVSWRITGVRAEKLGWIGLYERGNRDEDYITWTRVTKSIGETSFRAPGEGTYEVRYFEPNTFTRRDTSSRFTVVPRETEFTLSARTASAGSRTVRVQWTAVGGKDTHEGWIGFYKVGAPDNLYLAYTTAVGERGSASFVAPGPGNYEVRYHAAGSYQTEKVTRRVTITPQ